MRLAVFSHKLCWPSETSPTGYASDGGFPFQVRALSELFDETVLVVPVTQDSHRSGELALAGHHLRVRPLSRLAGSGLTRKFTFLVWLLSNAPALIHETMRSGGVHAAVPGDVGTAGLLLAVAFRKPLFVRHCGNWTSPRTPAEHFWRWIMEHLAGNRNVMFATGGGSAPPSRNAEIRWIFATSLSTTSFDAVPKMYSSDMPVRLVISCRQERPKGTGEVIRSLPYLVEQFPTITLDVAGGGASLNDFKSLAVNIGMTDRVRFHGKLSHAQVLELLSKSTLFCYPTSASEGFPKAVLEALAAGLPVVTTPVSVLPQLIGCDCGVVLEDTEPATIATAVASCLSPERYRSMSRRAIETARQYSLEHWRDTVGNRLRLAWGRLSDKAV